MQMWISPSTMRVLRGQLRISGSEAGPAEPSCQSRTVDLIFSIFCPCVIMIIRSLPEGETGSTACYSQNNTKLFIFFQMVKIVYFSFHCFKENSHFAFSLNKCGKSRSVMKVIVSAF